MRVSSLFITVLAGSAIVQASQVDSKISLFVNDRNVNAPVMLRNNTVFVPLRTVSNAMGVQTHWSARSHSISISGPKGPVVLHASENIASVYGKDLILDEPPQKIGGETMVSLQFLNDVLDAHCRWLDTENRVEIDTSNYSGIWSRDENVPSGTELFAELQTPVDSAFSHTGDPIVAKIPAGAKIGDETSNGAMLYGHVAYQMPAYDEHPGLIGLEFDKYQEPGGPLQRISGSIVSGPVPSAEGGGYHSSFVFVGISGSSRSPLMTFEGNFFADVVYDDEDPELTAWSDEKRPTAVNASVPAGTQLHILLNQVDEPAFQGPGM